MHQDKHFYIIMALLLVIIVLLVLVLKEQGKPATDLVDKANTNVEDCSNAIATWKQKYPVGTPISDPARGELSLILSECTAKIGNSN